MVRHSRSSAGTELGVFNAISLYRLSPITSGITFVTRSLRVLGEEPNDQINLVIGF